MNHKILKRIILIILAYSVITACSETETQSVSGENIPDNAEIVSYDGNGEVVKARVFEGGILIAEGEAIGKLKHGSWVTFDANALISSITTYHRGVKQGASIEMDAQGYVSIYANYVNDLLAGSYKVYNRRRLIEERSYVAGRLEGAIRKYYQDGTLMEESNYLGGRLDGIAKWYDTEGNLSIAYEYRDGELVDKEADVE